MQLYNFQVLLGFLSSSSTMQSALGEVGDLGADQAMLFKIWN
jgi:hypothetical protein